jgi:hypothetical protein
MVDLDPGKAPAWLGLTLADSGVYNTPKVLDAET